MRRAFVLLAFLVLGCVCMPTPEDQDERTGGAMEPRVELDPERFLEKFGYLGSGNIGHDGTVQHSDESRVAAIKQFQRMVHIPETGLLDDTTREWMGKRRCGMPDRIPEGAHFDGAVIAEAYQIPGSKWTKNRLYYKILNFSPDIDRGTQRRAFYYAFKFWSDVTNLVFYETTGEADINIQFVWREHGDGSYNAFDGQGGILAHAFFPEDGNMHFDEEERWTDNRPEGTNLLIVAAHEIGHALGLAHSQVRGALMAPYYQGYDPNFQLHSDDINGIQALYGQKSATPRPPQPTERATVTRRAPVTRPPTRPPPPTRAPTTTRPPTTTRAPTTTRRPIPTPAVCTTKFDAVFQGPDSVIYALRHKWVYQLNERGIERGFPVEMKTIFEKPPINVGGAVFSRRTNRLYMFKGNRIWRYSFDHNDKSFSMDSGFPRYVRDRYYPRAVDSAVADRTGRIYLFRGSFFYIFNQYYMTVERYNRRPIESRFEGIPAGVEASVMLRDGYMYFFKGQNYRKYLDGYGVVAGPKPKAGPWLGCGDPERQQPK